MKAIFVIIVLGAVIWGVTYYAGGYSSYDPSQQGKDAQAQIGPGMAWQKVTSIAGEPREYRPIDKKVRMVAGQEMVELKPGARNKFDAAGLTDRIAANDLPNGFQFEYRFSNSVAFVVTFDSSGTVESVGDLPTVSDLFK